MPLPFRSIVAASSNDPLAASAAKADRRFAELLAAGKDAAATLAIQSGRADATFGPNVTGAYKALLTGKTQLVGTVPGGWPKTANIAVTLKKGNGLVDAVQASLNSAIASGAYLQVLDRWGESVEKIDHSEINPPGLGD